MFKERNYFSITPTIKIGTYALVILTFLASLIWNVYTMERSHEKIFETIAETSLKKDKMYRTWAASHGGLYVPITKTTPPNPYLKVPNRDINAGGMQLTLMNPAYMTRQVMELYSGSSGAKGHITSLKPLNPHNAPDLWERKALQKFEEGDTAVSEFYTQDDKEYLHYMIPFIVTQSCIKCHGDQGYKIGDIRGGISVKLPLASFKIHDSFDILTIILTHFVLLLCALLIIRLLMDKAEHEYDERMKQQTLMFKQAKNAQMGEMLSMIAHQWRQPLNAISAASIVVNMRNELNDLDNSTIKNQMSFIQEQTQLLSKTIDEFMNFFRPEHKKVLIQPKTIMDPLNNLISAQLANRGIMLVCDVSSTLEFYSYPRELEHLLLNLITNARDAYENVNRDEKIIRIGCKHNNSTLEITVCDNAGGVPEEIIGRIFDPYFTTKEQGKGTGIGLYMVKRIVKEILGGTISVVNRDGGACFTVKVPME